MQNIFLNIVFGIELTPQIAMARKLDSLKKRRNMHIRQATIKDLKSILVLFNQYRDFYKKERDEISAEEFLSASLLKNQSIIFIATEDEDSNQVVGFARLIPGYCSLELTKYWVLYDLYTDENHRHKGVATDLLSAIKTFATEDGASRVDLQTAHTNLLAQKLYEKNGYKKDEAFCTYTLVLSRKVNECNLDQEKTARISMKK